MSKKYKSFPLKTDIALFLRETFFHGKNWEILKPCLKREGIMIIGLIRNYF